MKTLLGICCFLLSGAQHALSATENRYAGLLGNLCDQQNIKTPCRVLHSICLNNLCVCGNTFRQVGTQCVSEHAEQTSVDNACSTTSDCFGTGEFCSNFGYCRCLSTHVQVYGSCLPVVYPGERGCVDSRQCSRAFPGSVCSEAECVCPPGLRAQHRSCLPHSTLIRRKPASNGLSLTEEPVNGVRVQQQSDGSVPPGGICSQDNDCSGYPNAACSSTCICNDGAINTGSSCLAAGSLVRGSCSEGQVYVSEAGTCMNVARPGGACQYSQQCSGVEAGAFCVAQRCRCVYGMVVTATGGCSFTDTNCTQRGTVWIAELGQCKNVVGPGARVCSHRQQCTTAYPDSTCFLQQCSCPPDKPVAVDGTCGNSCPPGQTFSGVLGKCVPTVAPGDACQYTSQCDALYPGMVCARSRCRCPHERFWTGQTCSENCPQRRLRDTQSGLCRQECVATQISHEGSCLERVAPEGECQATEQCLGGSYCANLTCTCPENTRVQVGVCVQAAESSAGGLCDGGQTCMSGSFCERGMCRCAENDIQLNGQCVSTRPVLPGAACVIGVQNCTGGAACEFGFCMCPDGTVLHNSSCLHARIALPGDACDVGTLCTGMSQCVNNVCMCPQPMIIQGTICKAVKLVPPGLPCKPEQICSPMTQCTGGICTCVTGLSLASGQCVAAASAISRRTRCISTTDCTGGTVCMSGNCVANSVPPLGFCTSGELCTGGAVCDGLICSCPSKQPPVQNQCLPVTAVQGCTLTLCNRGDAFGRSVRIGGACTVHEHCAGGSLCQNNRCTCPVGQASLRGNCQFLPANPGASCENGETCMADSHCIEGVCSCAFGHIINHGACVLQTVFANPGEPCGAAEIRCSRGSVCLDRICSCQPGMTIHDNSCIITPTVPPGSDCSNFQLCVGNSYCSDGLCKCVMGFYLKDSACLLKKTAPPGGVCGIEISCLGGSQCEKQQCICAPGEMIINNTCIGRRTVNPGQMCFNDLDYCAGGSQCRNGLCQCLFGHSIENGLCLAHKRVHPGSVCGPDVRCTGGSHCEDAVCKCDEQSVIRHGRCILTPKVGPGEPCDRVTMCLYGSTCVDLRCRCPEDLIEMDNICVQMHSVTPGENCTVDDACIERAVCVNGTCTCLPSTVLIDANCLEFHYVMPGNTCEKANDICTGESSCISNICTCNDGLTLANGVCITTMTAKPGESCDNGEICGGNSVCNDGKCACPIGTILQESACRAQNLAFVPAGRNCAVGQKCTGGSLCFQGVCRCPAGLGTRNGVCMSQPVAYELAKTCQTDEHCKGGGAKCKMGVCLCPPNHMLISGKCRSLDVETYFVAPGSVCNSFARCANGSACIRGFCICVPGLQLVDDSCQLPVTVSQSKAQFPKAVTVLPGEKQFRKVPSASTSMVAGPSTSTPSGHMQSSTAFSSTVPRSSPDTDLPSSPPTELPSTISASTANSANPSSSPAPPTATTLPPTTSTLTLSVHIVPPGNPCIPLVFNCGDGSVCLQGYCQCSKGTFRSGQRCLPARVPPGASCAGGAQCDGGSTCVSGLCKCPSNKPHLVQRQCRQQPLGLIVARPGATCSEATHCEGGSQCVAGQCKCQQGSAMQGDICVRNTVLPKGLCLQTDICLGNSECFENKCTCFDGLTAVNGQCIQEKTRTASPGTACDLNTECLGNSFCYLGMCVCGTGTHQFSSSCGKTETYVPPGMSCRSGVACLGGSVCANGYCTCPSGDLHRSERCTDSTNIGAAIHCAKTGDCSTGFTCRSSVCVCASSQLCRPNTLPGTPGTTCTSSATCLGGSFCYLGFCTCPQGMVIHGSSCVSYVATGGPGQSCTSPGIVCGGGSRCLAGSCQCLSTTVVYGQKCVQRMAPPGLFCEPGVTTCTGGSVCDEGTNQCTCGEGSTERNGFCVTKPLSVLPGQPCDSISTEVDQCSFGSFCSENVCRCPINYRISQGVCVFEPQQATTTGPDTAPPGYPCNDNTVCTGGSSCTLNFCRCAQGYTPSMTTQTCQPTDAKRFVLPGGACTLTESICTGGSLCQDSVCQCQLGFENKEGICTKKTKQEQAKPGSPCELSLTECTGESACENGHCVCSSGEIVNSAGICVPISEADLTSVLPGSSCSPTSAPCERNSQCSQEGFCVCLGNTKVVDGFCVSSIDTDNVAIGQKCVLGVSTCAGHSVCRQGICYCMNEDVLRNGICVKRETNEGAVPLHGSCDATSSICESHSYCTNGTCECLSGDIVSSYGSCIRFSNSVEPGRACSPEDVCSNGTSCTNGKCVCNTGETQLGQPCSGDTASTEAEACPSDPRNSSCSPPECFCSVSGTEIPMGFRPEETPQMIVLTFDDPINRLTLNTYKRLFDGHLTNPNGCPIKGTFFVSHEWNDYAATEWLSYNGHEIAVNSISHEALSWKSQDRWRAEMDGMRQIFAGLSGIQPENVVGLRAPQFSVGSDTQYKMMAEQGFLYDHSLSADPGATGGGYWPQTLDYRMSWRCEMEPCPKLAHPGIWAVPVNQVYGFVTPGSTERKRALMVRGAMRVGDSPNDVKRLLNENFRRYYDSNRAPYFLTLSAGFLNVLAADGAYLALDGFLQDVLKLGDVWVVTARDAIAWMQSPTKLADMDRFQPWKCPRRQASQSPPCEKPKRCGPYRTTLAGETRYVSTCKDCPNTYPWLNNPSGN